MSLTRFRASHKHWWVLCAGLVAALTGLTIVNGLFGKGFTMPLSTNIVDRSGLGPLTLRDGFGLHPTPMLPEYFWLAVTLISVAGAAVLGSRIIFLVVDAVPNLFPFRLNTNEAGDLFLVLAGLVYLLPFFVNGFFDRHLLPAVPFLMAAALMHRPQSAAETRPQPKAILAGFAPANLAGALLLAGFIWYSVCGTRDYLAWNRARWLALNDLMQKDKIQPSAIDGGFEFNGYYLYRADYISDPKKSFWWVDDDAYLLNFLPATNYSVYRTYPYTHWMPSYTGNIYVLKRDGSNDLPKNPLTSP